MSVGSTPIGVSASFRSGNDEFRDALDSALTKMIDTDDTYDTIYAKWFPGESDATDDTTASTVKVFPAKDTITSGGTLDNIITSGELLFGSDMPYSPFEMLGAAGVADLDDGSGDKVSGFDADIAVAIAAEFSTAYGVTIKAVFHPSAWDPIIPNLEAGEFDAIISGMTKTPERDQVVDFTRSYFTSSQAVMAGPLYTDDGLNITTVADLNSASISVSVQTSTTGDIWAQANIPNADIKAYDTYDAQILALENKDVHLTVADFPVLAFFSSENPAKGTEVLFKVGDTELLGIAMRENSDEPSDDGFLPIPFMSVIIAFLALPIIIRKYRS
ncbi:MAG: transporter substrate-binding domain-containing protein [Candidatus Heimdallarchaeota archaeon]|nr:transporter substrate-binding domain-containing protein [Candidatus Heimdallarchaeota archaeon]